MCWSVEKAQKMLDTYLARRSTLAANAIQKLENYRDKNKEAATNAGRAEGEKL
jgi:hypothetical protein